MHLKDFTLSGAFKQTLYMVDLFFIDHANGNFTYCTICILLYKCVIARKSYLEIQSQARLRDETSRPGGTTTGENHFGIFNKSLKVGLSLSPTPIRAGPTRLPALAGQLLACVTP